MEHECEQGCMIRWAMRDLFKAQLSTKRWVSILPALLLFGIGIFGYVLRAVDYFNAVPGDLGDARFNSVILEHLFQWITGRVQHLWSPPFFYPFENALAFSDNHFGSSIFYIILRLAGLQREVAYDVWFVIGNCLNFLTAYVVFHRMGFRTSASAAGAFVFAYALPVLPKEGHAQLVYRLAVPLAYGALWELLSTKRLYLLWRVIFWTAIQFYCSIYLGVFLIYLLGATFLGSLILERRDKIFSAMRESLSRERLGRICLSFGVSLFCSLSVAWLLYHYYLVGSTYGFNRSQKEIFAMLPRLSSYLLSDGVRLSSWIGRSLDGIPMRHEHQMFFGFGVWIIALYGIVASRLEQAHKEVCKIAGISIVLLFVLTLNINGISAYYILANIPGFRAIRAVSRVVLVMLLPVSLMVAVGFEELLVRAREFAWGKRLFLVMMGFALLGAEVISYQTLNTPIRDWIERQAALRAHLPETVPEQPLLFATSKASEPFYFAELDAMILAQDMGVATLNGYSGNCPPGYLIPDACISYLNRIYGYADFHNIPRTSMDKMATRMVLLSPEPCEHEPIIISSDIISSEQAKRINVNVVPAINRNILAARIFVYNGCRVEFNTMSSNGPVRLSWRFVSVSADAEGRTSLGWDARKSLYWCIEAGGSRMTDISVEMPTVPGTYLFEVSLVQEGVAWLHDLGMNIARVPIIVDEDGVVAR